jgi:uncharacterized protein YkwD
MKRTRILAILLALTLTGCADTTVYLPEGVESAVTVPARETVAPTQTPTETAREERIYTEKIQFGGNSSENKTPSAPGTVVGSTTVTRPAEETTPPKETKPKDHSVTVTVPVATESVENEPESTHAITVTRPVIVATEPKATEGKGNSITVTLPVETTATEVPPEQTHATTVTRPVEFPTETPTEPPVVTPTEPPETPIEPPTQPPSYDISDYRPGALEYAIAEEINAYRGEKGLPALAYDPDLCAIASYRSFEVSRVWSHTRPDGRSFTTVLSDFDYRVSAAAELLGYATADAAAIAAKWIGSEDHQEILLGSSDTIGVGIYSANGVTYVTCLLVE